MVLRNESAPAYSVNLLLPGRSAGSLDPAPVQLRRAPTRASLVDGCAFEHPRARPTSLGRLIVAACIGVSSWQLPAAAHAEDGPEQVSSAHAARLKAATDHFRSGGYEAALAQFDTLLAELPASPERATIAFNAAVCSYALERYADARSRFDAVARGAPEFAKLARVNAGFAALRAGDIAAAEEYAEAAAEPPSADIERRRQQLLQEIDAARRAVSTRELDTLVDLGFEELTRKQWALARANLQRALSLAGPEDTDSLADAHYGLGLVALELSELEAAERHLERSVEHRPEDARAWMALGRVAEQRENLRRAEAAYEAVIGSPGTEATLQGAERSLLRLYRLPLTGPSGFAALTVGHDNNAAQSGSNDLVGAAGGEPEASAFVSGMLGLGMTLRATRRHALGVTYSGDMLALLNPSVEDLSLQAHELLLGWQWAPSVGVRLRLDAGAAHALTGLESLRPFAWDAVMSVRADIDTSRRSRARLQVAERLTRASELSYVDGHRTDLLAAHSWSLGRWELGVQGSLRYNVAGTQMIQLEADAHAECAPGCEQQPYANPLSYWSPGGGALFAWNPVDALRLSSVARGEYRGYSEQSGIAGIPASQKARRDFRWYGRLGADLSLDEAGTWRLTLDHTVLASLSNMAFDPTDERHRFDYGDRRFVQQTTEIGVAASF